MKICCFTERLLKVPVDVEISDDSSGSDEGRVLNAADDTCIIEGSEAFPEQKKQKLTVLSLSNKIYTANSSSDCDYFLSLHPLLYIKGSGISKHWKERDLTEPPGKLP